MVKVVDPIRFWVGLAIIASSLVVAIISLQYWIWLLILVGLAFIVDGVTARRCPNGHFIYMWSRIYGTNVQYCPRCGQPLNGLMDQSQPPES
ncbi:MAG TPA: hypothetical protein VE177_04840 [Candidatus Binatus sp.]|nr:hypothetical protein [Candidatus Binatus sp.]